MWQKPEVVLDRSTRLTVRSGTSATVTRRSRRLRMGTLSSTVCPFSPFPPHHILTSAPFAAILGWTNNATVGTILAYVFYWLTCVAALVYMKWKEGRTTFLGLKSKAWHRREARKIGETSDRAVSRESEEEKKVETPLEENRQFASHI
jgi:hypothetical protein